jgi:hypothetical protein
MPVATAPKRLMDAAGARPSEAMSVLWAQWPYWRATPGLVAHVARVCAKVAGSLSDKKPHLSIDVAMRGDTEVFKSPEDFSQDITREALQNFETLTLKARGHSLKIAVTFSRDPHIFRARERDDNGVLLRVEAKTGIPEQQVKRAGERLSRAIDRGRPWRAPPVKAGWSKHDWRPGKDERTYWAKQLTIRLVTAIGSLLPLAGIYAFADVSKDRAWVYLAVFVVCFGGINFLMQTGGHYLKNWLFPAVEIAPHGNSNAWRTAKWLFLLGVGALVTVILS